MLGDSLNVPKQVESYSQEPEPFVHIHYIAYDGSVVAQPASIGVVVVVVDVYAVLPGTKPLVMRPVRVATIKCHFHSGDRFSCDPGCAQ
jgi:hypothetical protein